MLIAGLLSLGGYVKAAEVDPQTLGAYERYVESVRVAFLERIGHARTTPDAPWAAGLAVDARPQTRTGAIGEIVRVPGGLVHHWRGTTFIDGVTLDHVLRVAQAYDGYASVYRSVVRSRLVTRTSDTFQIAIRIKEDAGPMTSVLDVRSVVRYTRGAGDAYSFGEAIEILPVKNAGKPDERYGGVDDSHLWRAHTFTWFVARDGGVQIALDTVGLSRPFPPLLGWLAQPIAKRLGRSSVERTLGEFRRAVLAAATD